MHRKSQEKLKTMVKQTFGGKTKIIMVILKVNYGPVRTRLTNFVWLNEKSHQELSPPNFQFGHRGRT